MNRNEFQKNPNHKWYPVSDYGTDDKYMYRFHKDGSLASKQEVSDPWLSEWGAVNFESIKYQW